MPYINRINGKITGLSTGIQYENQEWLPDDDKEIIEYLKNKNKIEILKQNLANTDYKAIQFAEGIINITDYLPYKTQREEWRKEIRSLENAT